MKVQSGNINFRGSMYGDLKKGKQAFDALSRTEQAGKIGAEMFRQDFNNKNVGFKLSAQDNDLAGYIKFKVSIINAIEKVTEKFRRPKY